MVGGTGSHKVNGLHEMPKREERGRCGGISLQVVEIVENYLMNEEPGEAKGEDQGNYYYSISEERGENRSTESG